MGYMDGYTTQLSQLTNALNTKGKSLAGDQENEVSVYVYN